MKRISFYLLIAILFIGTSCSENYSKGERIGFINKFSKKGLIWKTWEGELNLTQTGMNSSSLWDWSLDRDDPNELLFKTLDSAAVNGWKVKLKYHETYGWNWLNNRGETNYFVTGCEVLDKTMVNNIKNITNPNGVVSSGGSAVDTIYVIVIDPKDVKKYLK